MRRGQYDAHRATTGRGLKEIAGNVRQDIKFIKGGGASIRRLALGFGANSISQIVTIALMFGSLPILLHEWGAAYYGLWIVLSAMPAYLSIGDFGFGTAAGIEMTMAAARGDIGSVQRIHQSLLLLTLTALLVLGATVTLIIVLLPGSWLPRAAIATSSVIRASLVALSISTLMSLAWNSTSAAFRAAGKYPASVMFNEAVRIVEGVGIIGAAVFHGGILGASLASMLVRTTGLVGGLAFIKARIAWVQLSVSSASYSELRRLIGPAIAVTALPLGFAIGLQGMTLVVGATLGLTAVALFSSIRSLTRMVVQAVGVCAHAIGPEVSLACGRNDTSTARRLIFLNAVLTIGVILVFFIIVALFGRVTINIWSNGLLKPKESLILLLSAAAGLQALWNANGNMLLASNRQSEYTYWFVAAASLSILAALMLARAIGLSGVAFSLIMSDTLMVVITTRRILITIGE